MAELKIEFPEVYSVKEGPVEIPGFLKQLILKAGDKIAGQLLSYHLDEGGAMKITEVELEWVNYDPGKRTGKIGLSYHLGYYYTCSDSNKDYHKEDTVDFVIDKETGMLILTFLDLIGRSTAEEF